MFVYFCQFVGTQVQANISIVIELLRIAQLYTKISHQITDVGNQVLPTQLLIFVTVGINEVGLHSQVTVFGSSQISRT